MRLGLGLADGVLRARPHGRKGRRRAEERGLPAPVSWRDHLHPEQGDPVTVVSVGGVGGITTGSGSAGTPAGATRGRRAPM